MYPKHENWPFHLNPVQERERQVKIDKKEALRPQLDAVDAEGNTRTRAERRNQRRKEKYFYTYTYILYMWRATHELALNAVTSAAKRSTSLCLNLDLAKP